jgi:hypothetical protein
MPSESSVEDLLREIHAPRVEPPALGPAGEREAVELWAARYGEGTPAAGGRERSGPGFGLLGLLAAHRLAVAIGALLMVIVGACVLPTSYEVPLGLSLEIRGVPGQPMPVREIADHVRERSGAGEVDVLMRQAVRDGGEPVATLSIRLWDQDLVPGELEGELRETFPSLAGAQIHETALEGEVETIWARRLAHRTLRLSLREADVEQARLQLLTQLQAQGFEDEEVVVKVRDRDDGHREVEVQIERHHVGGEEPPDLDAMPRFEWVMDPQAEDSAEAVRVLVGEP